MWTFMWFLTGVWGGWKLRENADDNLAKAGDKILADGSDDAMAQLLHELGPSAVDATVPKSPPPPEPEKVEVLVS